MLPPRRRTSQPGLADTAFRPPANLQAPWPGLLPARSFAALLFQLPLSCGLHLRVRPQLYAWPLPRPCSLPARLLSAWLLPQPLFSLLLLLPLSLHLLLQPACEPHRPCAGLQPQLAWQLQPAWQLPLAVQLLLQPLPSVAVRAVALHAWQQLVHSLLQPLQPLPAAFASADHA